MTPALDQLLQTLPDLPREGELELDYELRQQAGVSLLVRAADPIDVLFIKRAKNPRDPWSGHMALPGGRREHSDQDLLATAIRETSEETRIDLGSGRLVGRMPKVAPRGPRLPTIVVVPFLFVVPADTQAVGEPGEVERTRWVPLHHLQNAANLQDYVIEMPAGRRTFPSYRIDDDVIWGMTYRIIEDFLLLAEGKRPAGL